MNLKELLPSRPEDMHKGVRGRLLIAGGSRHYHGAPALSALGALRSGSGVVTLMSLKYVCESCAARLPEVVYHPVESWRDCEISAESINALVAGPGLTRSYEAQKFIADMWREWPKKILVDGDGLYSLAVNHDKLNARKDSVITPHEGEAGRLLGITPADVRADRMSAVRELSRKWGCVVLKGHGTLITSGDRVEQVNRGGAELSVPGSGDVLAGCIGAFLAMGLDPFDAAVLGVNIHGMAGEILARDGIDGVLASEIAHTIRKVIHSLRCSDEA